jgi:hypothetical protein
MTMRFPCGWLLATIAMAAPLHAQTDVPVPSFRALEDLYRQDPSLSANRAALARALPIGTPLDAATAKLTGAGAECRPWRKRRDATRCLIHRYSFADRAADDVRWTIALTAPGGRLSGMTVDRYVDRHGN